MDRIVRFYDWDCHVKVESYSQSGNDAIILVDARDGAPVATATVNIRGLREDEVAIKNYGENTGILDVLIDAGVISQPLRYESSGYTSIPVCQILI